jgi:FkbM family methyltransferase
MSKQQHESFELRLFRSLGSKLPRVRGAGVIGNMLARRYRRKPRPPIVSKVLDFKMHLDPHEFVDSRLLFMPQLYDYREIAFLRRHLESGDIFVDVGANIGFYSLVASRCVGDSGKVIAIEAEPSTFEILAANVELNGMDNVIPANFGASDKEEVLSMRVSAGHGLYRNRGSNSFLHDKDGEVKQIPCKPLGTVFDEFQIPRIDGLKLDTEGFEYRIFKAFFSGALPAEQLPRFIIFEQNPGVETQEDSVALLEDVGYKVCFRTRQTNVVMTRDPHTVRT